ncbi:hypothetical protein [Pseudonocardia nigra]|uniref:hypothetical protein n=1 Tax=Pseudonocardia nigra TaxID=1921578 RepID=UPI001C5E67E4|nr:hypothetical protein [Pseudonocardia nigra]
MANPTRSWAGCSSGKDSAFAVDVVGLLPTLDAATRRVPVPGVPHAVVQAQAEALGLPLRTLDLRPAELAARGGRRGRGARRAGRVRGRRAETGMSGACGVNTGTER